MRTLSLNRERSLYHSASDHAREALRRDLAQLQEQMTTHKRVNRASDDPTAYSEARRMEKTTGEYEQYIRSIGASRSWATATEEHLSVMSELVTSAYEYGVRGATDTMSADERETLATRIDGIRAEMVEQLNAKHGDEYLFAGNHSLGVPTPGPVPPFDANGDPAPAAGDYSLIGGARNRQIGPNTTLKVNITGEEVHRMGSGVTVVDALEHLSAALRNPAGTPSISSALGEVTDARDHLIDRTTQIGGIINRLDSAEGQTDEAITRLKGRQSELEDADFVEVASALQRKQGSLEAALKVTASMLRTSLVDYL